MVDVSTSVRTHQVHTNASADQDSNLLMMDLHVSVGDVLTHKVESMAHQENYRGAHDELVSRASAAHFHRIRDLYTEGSYGKT